MPDTLASCRRGKLAAVAAPTISSLNRAAGVRSPARTPLTTNPAKPSSPQAPSRPPSTATPSSKPLAAAGRSSTDSPAKQRLCKATLSPACSLNSDRLSLSQASLDRSMASFDRKSTSRALKSQSDKLKQPSINSERASDEAKSAEMNQKRRPISASAQPKKTKNAMLPAVDMKATNEVKQSKEKSLSRGRQNGPVAYSKLRREKMGVRDKRRGLYHVTDLQLRRKGLSHRRQTQHLKRNGLDDAANLFSLTNLEQYLKERGAGALNVARTLEDMEDSHSPSSHLPHLPKPHFMVTNRRLVFVGESPSQLVDSSSKDQRLLAKFSVHTNVSAADELDDVAHQLNSDMSNRCLSRQWPANGRSSKNESLLHYAGSCFSVSRRRRRQVAYMYNSERSISSSASDTETVPLMTEPEPFHDYSDDLSASSAVLYQQLNPPLGHGEELAYNGYKDIHLNEACSLIKQDLSSKTSREIACKSRSISQKYRPKSFKDLLGQKMVSESLSNAILRSKIAPVYLFHGPRGTGKTTAAKIFSCAMNCLSIEELRPCGLCKECISFNAGNNYDVKEVDAAANNEIESMKLMLKHLSLPPSVSRYKVFIMDDCHMLTAEAWNALLKSLEEPPDYIVFILITTNLEQLPRAAMSRCQKFVFNRIKDADVVFRLRRLAQQEKVEIEAEALHFIAAQSDGSLRDAETMLDQLSLLGKRVTLGTVREMVGLIPEEGLINLLEVALSADTVSTVNGVREFMASGVEPLALVSQLAILITDILAGRCQSARFLGTKLRKDQQDKLQQALMVLSNSEKQLRSCSERTTWLTAAFLQFASNIACSHPSSSRGTSLTQSPAAFPDVSEKDNLHSDGTGRRHSWGGKEKWDVYAPLHLECAHGQPLSESPTGPYLDNRIYPCDHTPQLGTSVDEKAVSGVNGTTLQSVHNKSNILGPCTIDQIWQKVLQGSCSDVLRQLLQEEGRLISLSFTEAFAIVSLEFRSPEHKSMAESAKQNISNAFQVALFCPVKVEISLSPSHGQHDFQCRSKHILLDHEDGCAHDQGSTRGSFKKSSSSSFKNMDQATSSPRCHDPEHWKSVHGHEGDARARSRRSTDSSFRNLQAYNRPGETTSDALHSCANNGGIVTEHVKDKQQRSSFEDPRCSAALHWSDTRDDLEYSSDSEVDGRYVPSILCWKGTQMKDGKAKHHVLRRRRARFLLRLVPCGKDDNER